MNKTQAKTKQWSEKELKDLYNSLVTYNAFVRLDWIDCQCDLENMTYEAFEDAEGTEDTYDHNKSLPNKDKFIKLVEKFITEDIKSEVKEAAKTIATNILSGMESYADDHQPEDPQAKINRLSQELKDIEDKRTQFLSQLTSEERKQLSQMIN